MPAEIESPRYHLRCSSRIVLAGEALPLPFARRQHARQLALDVDAGLLAEAELRRGSARCRRCRSRSPACSNRCRTTRRSTCTCRPCRGRRACRRGSGAPDPESGRSRVVDRLAGVRRPDVSAASARNGLIVEPGGYAPRSGRFSSGLSGDSFSSCQFAASMPSTNRFGSKPGFDTNASTSPVAGSIATSAPRRSPNAASAICCSSMSSDSVRLLPAIGGVRFSVRTARPPESTSTSSTPVCRAARARTRARCRPCRCSRSPCSWRSRPSRRCARCPCR